MNVAEESSELNEMKEDLPLMTVASERGTCGERMVRRYARADLEALRFADVDLQKEKWREVHHGLDPRVLQEYDELTEDGKKKVNKNSEHRRLWERKKEPVVGKSEQIAEQIEDQPGIILGGNWNEEESWVAEEEECDEYDSDEEYASIQRPAFAVEGEPDYESGPPQDGWEYLRRVRWEAAQLPRVRVAKVDRSRWSDEQTPYMPKIPEIARCPENLRPSKLWMDQFLADFSDLKKAFTELENSPDRINLTPAATDEVKGGGDPEGLESKKTHPTLSAVLKMDPVARATDLRNRVQAFESAGSLSRDDCLWIFALCAAIDAPLDAQMGSCQRRLLRKSSALLAKKTDPCDEEVARLNILIAISGRFFGQSEEN